MADYVPGEIANLLGASRKEEGVAGKKSALLSVFGKKAFSEAPKPKAIVAKTPPKQAKKEKKDKKEKTEAPAASSEKPAKPSAPAPSKSGSKIDDPVLRALFKDANATKDKKDRKSASSVLGKGEVSSKSSNTWGQSKKTRAAKLAGKSAEKKMETQEERDDKLRRTLFVGNVPLKKNAKKQLSKICADKGFKIESLRFRSIPLEVKFSNMKKHGAAMGEKAWSDAATAQNCYVVLPDEEAVEKRLGELAKALSGHVMDKNTLRTDFCSKEARTMDRKRTIFVGNLPLDAGEEDVRAGFADKKVEIMGVRIIRDPNTFIGKGFGFVLFKERGHVPLALKFKQIYVKERPIRITKVMKDHEIQKYRKDQKEFEAQNKVREGKKRDKLKARVKSGKLKKNVFEKIRDGQGPKSKKWRTQRDD